MNERIIYSTERLIDPNELAKELSVHVTWVYSRTRQKGPDAIPHLRAGKYLRFRLSEVLDWLKNQSEES